MSFTEYKLPLRQGIDDLKSLYAFHGNSQGDDHVSNNIDEYLNSGGWMSFGFDCELTKEAISEEVLKRRKWNEAYIEKLKASGDYGKVAHITIKLKHNPLFDE